ncbi:MAG: STAS domain-containing protein [Candidatus Omnitrophica bacterium]|nr:STAS domain-containing protein [Candidatus Omnitrophota bacterium]
MMALNIKIVKKKDYVYHVELKGSLDTDTYRELEDELKEIIDDKTKAIILDMSGVSYISSAGISVVVHAKKALKERHATFAMTNLQPQIEKVFAAMKILPIIDIFDNMPEADKYIDQIIKEEIDRHNASKQS